MNVTFALLSALLLLLPLMCSMIVSIALPH
jgi:hypothetical protein